MTDSSGNKQAARYQMVPQKLVHLKPDAAAKMALRIPHPLEIQAVAARISPAP